MKAHVRKNALCCWYAEVFPSCFCGGMFNLGTVFPKMAKTLLRSICVQSQSSFAQRQSSQALPWASAGLLGCGDQRAFPAEQRLVGLLVVYPTQQSDVEITSSCSWQFDVSLGWSCNSVLLLILPPTSLPGFRWLSLIPFANPACRTCTLASWPFAWLLVVLSTYPSAQ